LIQPRRRDRSDLCSIARPCVQPSAIRLATLNSASCRRARGDRSRVIGRPSAITSPLAASFRDGVVHGVGFLARAVCGLGLRDMKARGGGKKILGVTLSAHAFEECRDGGALQTGSSCGGCPVSPRLRAAGEIDAANVRASKYGSRRTTSRAPCRRICGFARVRCRQAVPTQKDGQLAQARRVAPCQPRSSAQPRGRNRGLTHPVGDLWSSTSRARRRNIRLSGAAHGTQPFIPSEG